MFSNCGVEGPFDCKKIQPVHPKENQSWIYIGRTDAEAETPILWPPHAMNWFIWKDPDAGKDWRWEEKGKTEDEMIGWHHWLNGWVWVSSGSWWWTGKPGMLQSMESQRFGHNWVTELNWNGQKIWTITRKYITMPHKHEKMHSCTHEKLKLKPHSDTIFHHQTGILKLDNALYWQNYKEISTLIGWWKRCKVVHSY